MAKETKYTESDFHRKMAVGLFNKTWDLMDKTDRTPFDDDTMVHAAHASRYHWGEIGSPLEFERGEWQISRVYAVLNRAEPALHHAQRCLKICQQNDIGDFDIAFAHEAMARAYALAGDVARHQEYLELARQAGEAIEEDENRDYFFSELETIRLTK